MLHTNLFADRLKKVAQSPTLALTKLVAEMRAEGREILDLSAGEPDFSTPDNIIAAAIEAMNRGQTKYTPVDGTIELRRAISAKFKRENELTYAPDQILVSTGAKQVLFNAIMATVGEGDGVIIPAPYWVSYTNMVDLAGGNNIIIETKVENGFKLKPEDLDRAIRTNNKVKWFLLNSPNNPSGAVYTMAELKALAEVLLKYPQIYIMTDDIYEHLVYDGIQYSTIAQVEPRLYERTLTINGVSKAYNMTGWRIGYAGGPKELIAKMRDIQGHSTSNASSISQAAVVEALTGPQDFIARQRNVYSERRNMVVNMLNDVPGLNCLKPQGAFYVFPECSKLKGSKTPGGDVIKNGEDLAGYFLKSEGVAVVPGIGFGCNDAFRVSYATSTEVLKRACLKINNAVGKLTLG